MQEVKKTPSAIELEETVLGAILIEKSAIYKVKPILGEQSFYVTAHQLIYKAVIELDNEGTPVDLMTVMDRLNKNNDLKKVGGASFVTSLTNHVSSDANLEYHVMILKQYEMKRDLITSGNYLINSALDPSTDPLDTAGEVSKKISSMLSILDLQQEMSNVDLVKEATRRIELAKMEQGLTGKKSGFMAIDKITGGWQNGDLIYVAARPAMGKTALVLTMSRNMAVEFDYHVAFFSLEMTSQRLMTRLISAETEIPLSTLQKGNMHAHDWTNYNKRVTPLTKENLHIFDRIKNIHSIKSKSIDLKMKGKLDCIVIDYLQLIEYPQFKKNREREVSEISRALKLLAMDLDVPIICLSQLSREVEKRSDKKPQLSDLRDSGSIEQDADMVMFLFRPEYYDIPNSPPNLSLGMIRKNRHGAIDTVDLRFNGPLVKFTDWENDIEQPTDSELPF